MKEINWFHFMKHQTPYTCLQLVLITLLMVSCNATIFDYGAVTTYQTILLGNNITVCNFTYNGTSYDPGNSNYSYNFTQYIDVDEPIFSYAGTEEIIENLTSWNNSDNFCDVWVSPFTVYCDVLIVNLSDDSAFPFSDSYVYDCPTTTTTTISSTSTSSSSSTSTTGGVTTTTIVGTTTTGGVTTTGGTPSSVPGTTLYGYSFPDGDFGTLPGLNGTGGITINNGSLKNMTCTGFCIIGLKKEEFQLYAAVMIVIVVLISIKPFKLGATASAVALLFFNNILGWTTITGSLMVIFVFISLAAWWLEGKK